MEVAAREQQAARRDGGETEGGGTLVRTAAPERRSMSQMPPPTPHLAPHLAHARNDWYAVADANSMAQGPPATRLLGGDIHIAGRFDAPVVTDATGRPLPTEVRFDHLWTTLGDRIASPTRTGSITQPIAVGHLNTI